jgi:hypothetical protein
MIAHKPVSRFWAFQGTETGIVIVPSRILIALARQLALTRDP